MGIREKEEGRFAVESLKELGLVKTLASLWRVALKRPAFNQAANQCCDLVQVGVLDDIVGGPQLTGFVAVRFFAGGGIDDDRQASELGLLVNPLQYLEAGFPGQVQVKE